MTHAEVEAKFSDYSEGELTNREAAEIRAHLATCDSCRAAYEGFLGTVWKVSKLRTHGPQPPERFLESLKGRIHDRSQGRFFSHKRLWARFPLETVSFVTLLVLLVTYIVLVALEPTRVQEVVPGSSGGAPP